MQTVTRRDKNDITFRANPMREREREREREKKNARDHLIPSRVQPCSAQRSRRRKKGDGTNEDAPKRGKLVEERGFDCFVAKKCCRVAHFEEEEEEISFPVEIFKRVLLIYLVGFKNTGFYRHAYYET